MDEKSLIWKSATPELKALLKKMLTIDPAKRPDMDTVKNDQWF
jgi:hypothetical protein